VFFLDKAHIPDKLKSFFSDMIWSVCGLVLMNVIAQFIVYPAWNAGLGREAYGNIVYLLAVMNTIAITVGSGINYSRMRSSAEGKTNNQPYLVLMICGTVLAFPILLLLQCLGTLQLRGTEFILFYLLTASTMWRYYADVEYRLYINYKGYFCYYAAIGIGYLIGIELFRQTGLWPLALLPGEAAGLLLVLWKGSIFTRDTEKTGREWKQIFSLTLILVGSNLVSQLIFNGDRILLKILAGANAVTIYYIASLLGKTMALLTTPLNGVLIGYISRYDGKLTCSMMNVATGLSVAGAAVMTVACTAASHIFVPVLYPMEYEEARRLFLIANLAQVLYFIGNVLVSSVILRFTKAKNQITINAAYGISFCALCCPLAAAGGVDGFCIGLLLINALRLLICLLLGYHCAMKGEKHGYQ